MKKWCGSSIDGLLSSVKGARRGIDSGASKSFILREVVESLRLKIINEEALIIFTFGCKDAQKRLYDIVEIVLQNVNNPNKMIKIKAIVVDSKTLGHVKTPIRWIRKMAFDKGIELADIGTSNKVQVLIGSEYIWEILGERNDL